MKKSIYIIIFLSINLSGQVVTNGLENVEQKDIKRNPLYNLEEIKVRWKKTALENCPGVPCVVSPSLPPSACGSITSVLDRESNSYPVVSIGTQCWMASNLRVTTYNDGAPIHEILSTQTWDNTLMTGARTVYNDLSANLVTYGYLYNWWAVADSRKICPDGWHVPIHGEWTILRNFLGGSSVAGGKMKSTGTTYWSSQHPGTDNSSGFSGLPGGYRDPGFGYFDINNVAYFWSASDDASIPIPKHAIFRSLQFNDNRLYSSIFQASSGMSVRCLMN